MAEPSETLTERYIREIDVLIKLLKNRPLFTFLSVILFAFFCWHYWLKQKFEQTPIQLPNTSVSVAASTPTIESSPQKILLTERFISSHVNDHVQLFMLETADIISFRIRASKEWNSGLLIDVNQNNRIDPYVDVSYSAFNVGTPCFSYLLSNDTLTTCGGYRSKAKIEISRENDSWKSTIFHIPRAELTNGNGFVWLNVTAYNSKTNENIRDSFDKLIKVTLSLR